MKKIIITNIFCSIYIFVLAQQPYPPAPPAVVNITAMEYFIDNNPAFGNGTPLTGFTAATTINNFNGTINLTGVTPGFHRFYIRSKDADGKWSITQNSFFDNYAVPVYNAAPPATANITAIEYFIDNNPGFGNGTPLTGFTAANNINNFNGTVSLAGVNPGFHRFYIRTKDASNIWSITNNKFLDNFSTPVYNTAPAPVTNIVQLEYFLDNNDLGFGNCTPITFTAGTNIANLNANINITGLVAGVHRLFIRSKDAYGKWSITNFSIFDNSATSPYPNAPAAAPAIGNMEYYIDTDPGFGNATAITVPGNTGNISNYAININLSGSLSNGTHYLYIRSKQNPWSVTNVVPFSASGSLPLTWSYIQAQLQNNSTLVSWGTQQESNTNKFTIEHSVDGRTFTTVGETAAAGFSSNTKNYSFTHLQPISGFNYYRIKQIDNNGDYKYSAVVTVLKKNDLKHTIIAPSPASNYTFVLFSKPAAKATVSIFNTNGQLVKTIAIADGQTQIQIDVSNFAKGKYIIRLVNNKTEETLSLLKL